MSKLFEIYYILRCLFKIHVKLFEKNSPGRTRSWWRLRVALPCSVSRFSLLGLSTQYKATNSRSTMPEVHFVGTISSGEHFPSLGRGLQIRWRLETEGHYELLGGHADGATQMAEPARGTAVFDHPLDLHYSVTSVVAGGCARASPPHPNRSCPACFSHRAVVLQLREGRESDAGIFRALMLAACCFLFLRRHATAGHRGMVRGFQRTHRAGRLWSVRGTPGAGR